MRLLLLVALIACAPAPAGQSDFSERAVQASSADFRVAQHEAVRSRYLRLTTTEEGRGYLERSLVNREDYPELKAAIAARGLPAQLEAVAFVESGFSNIPDRPPERPAAGLWQFIPKTARTYGLVVDDQVDERLDRDKSTQAALSLLVDLHASFGDWGAAFAAYNVGERRVREVMEEQGTQDVWVLIERGALPTYAADVMAASLVL